MKVIITPGDFDIYELLKQGLTNAELAEQLCLKPKTIQNRLARMYKKCGVKNRNSLVFFPAENFVVSLKRPSTREDYSDRVEKCHKQGMTAREISERYQLSTSTIYNYIRKLRQEGKIQ